MTKYIWWATLLKICKVLVLTIHCAMKDWMHSVKDGNHKNMRCGALAKGSFCRLKCGSIGILDKKKRWDFIYIDCLNSLPKITTSMHFNEQHYSVGMFYKNHINNFPWKPRWSCCWWKWNWMLKHIFVISIKKVNFKWCGILFFSR